MLSTQDIPDLLHTFKFGIDTKPIKAILNIHQALIPYSEHFTLSANSKMLLSEERDTAFIVLMETGCFSLCHRTNDIHLGTAFAPTVSGLIDAYSLYYDVKERPQHYIQAETACSGWKVPLDIFLQKSDELELWHDVARILAQRLMVMSSRNNEIVGNDIYKRIRLLLIELWLYPEEVRLQIRVAAFIHKRTGASKSRIMGILAELRKGNYIVTESGFLISLSKLPESF